MTIEETIALLAFAACFDQRTVGHADAGAWHSIAEAAGWTFPLAKRATLEHYAQHRERIMPADITKRIQAARTLAHEAFAIPYHPPELADDGPAFVAWARSVKAAHMTRCLADWADTGQLPTPLELED